MAIKDDWVYILSNYRGYLAPIRQFGPIVHPAKVKRSEATALMMAGCPITIYDPETKQSYPLTFENATKSVKEVLCEIQKPIETTVLNGAPKGAGDLGIAERNKPVEPKMKVDLEATIKKVQEEAPITTSGQATTDADSNADDLASATVTTTKVSLEELLSNNELTEDQVVWSDYTKSERRQIRAHLSALASASTEEA